MRIYIIGCTLLVLSPALAIAQTTETIVPHPALETISSGAEAMHPTHQLGKFGESFVREDLRASGFEVHDANLNDRGIDLLAVRRDAQGTLVEVRPVEVKTRSRGAEARLEMTRDGRQLSAEWTDKRLARLAQEHPDPRLRQLASEVLRLKEAHPEKVRPQLHTLSIGEDSYRVFRVDAKTGAVEGVASESSVTRFLKRISQADVSPATRQAASRHLQQFDQIQASALGREVSTPHISARTAAVAPIKPGPAPTQATKLLPGAVVEAAAAESRLVAKALPIATKTLGIAAVAVDGGVRVYQAYEVEQQFQRGEISDRDRVVAHAKNGAGMAGGLSGAFLLGSQGAAWGSALGPIGTAGGGLIGGVGGYFGGEKLAEVVVDQAADAIHAGVNAARDAATWAGGQATHLWGLTTSRLGW